VTVLTGKVFFASIALVGLVSCRAPKSELKEPIVVRVGIHHFKGSYAYEVDSQGNAKHMSSRGHGMDEDAKTVYAKVDANELHQLAKVLRDHHLCSKRSSDRPGIPDEAHPSVAVKLEDVDCRVSMWDGEWRDDSDAHACLEALEALGSKIAERGK
jgi:hypothetical protein